jgi:hypothetical protein
MARISYYVWTACDDELTCPSCREKNGKEWKRKKDIPVQPPLKTCTSPEGCRCAIVPVYVRIPGQGDRDPEGVPIRIPKLI